MSSGNHAPSTVNIKVWRMVYDSLPIMPAERKRCPILDGSWDNLQFMHAYIDACTIRMVFNNFMTPISFSCSALSLSWIDICPRSAFSMLNLTSQPLLRPPWPRFKGPHCPVTYSSDGCVMRVPDRNPLGGYPSFGSQSLLS
jgi:hypothetical protein